MSSASSTAPLPSDATVPTEHPQQQDTTDTTTAMMQHRNDERTSLLLLNVPRDYSGAQQTVANVWLWSWIFSATPSAAIACLSLATARLGSIGAWQSGNFIFHLHFICRTTWCNTVIQMFGISPCHDGGDDVVLCLCGLFLCRHGLSTCGINSGMDGSCHWWNWCWFHVDSTRCVLCTMC